MCERAFDKCLAPTAGGEGCDNMTMILVQFKKISDHGASSENRLHTSNDRAEFDQK